VRTKSQGGEQAWRRRPELAVSSAGLSQLGREIAGPPLAGQGWYVAGRGRRRTARRRRAQLRPAPPQLAGSARLAPGGGSVDIAVGCKMTRTKGAWVEGTVVAPFNFQQHFTSAFRAANNSLASFTRPGPPVRTSRNPG